MRKEIYITDYYKGNGRLKMNDEIKSKKITLEMRKGIKFSYASTQIQITNAFFNLIITKFKCKRH